MPGASSTDWAHSKRLTTDLSIDRDIYFAPLVAKIMPTEIALEGGATAS